MSLEKKTIIKDRKKAFTYPTIVTWKHEVHAKEVGGLCIGPYYSPKYNIIGLEFLSSVFQESDFENIALEVIIHETLHWLLSKFVCEAASYWLDSDTVADFLLESFNESATVWECLKRN
jgi:hypothetical protein